jgi:tRNA threonylcarbamoyladenosine biosynthesis protein TsaE
MSMAILISKSPDETFALGQEWGREARRGWIIGLSGDLGAGKTELVKGLAAGLGSSARVHSPTFALLNEYRDGRLPLFHLDLYRLNSREEVIGAGLEEYLTRPDGVSVVEWIERWNGGGQPGRLAQVIDDARIRFVRIETLSELERRIEYEDSSA